MRKVYLINKYQPRQYGKYWSCNSPQVHHHTKPMTSKMIDGVEIRTYSVRKNYSGKQERKMTIAFLFILVIFSFILFGELNGAPDTFINDSALFISTHN